MTVQPINNIRLNHIQNQQDRVFRNSHSETSLNDTFRDYFAYTKQQDAKHDRMVQRFAMGVGAFGTMLAVPCMIYSIPKLLQQHTLKKNIDSDFVLKQFQSLSSDKKIPTLDTCKSINKNLKDFLQAQVNHTKADNELLEEAGKPGLTNRLLLYGIPGSGKSFFAKIFAKTLNADYLEVKYADFNSMWAGQGTDKMKKIFENILDISKKNSDKKYVVTFNEIDTILQPIEKITRPTLGTHFMTKLEHRATFLTYIDELSEKAPNVIVVGTTNISPKNNGLDGAAMSRFKNITEVPLPDRECLFEALKMNLKDIKNSEDFFNSNEEKLKMLAKEMEEKKYSFRNMENVVEISKNRYLEDKMKDKTKSFDFEYLKHAKESISLTDGELKGK